MFVMTLDADHKVGVTKPVTIHGHVPNRKLLRREADALIILDADGTEDRRAILLDVGQTFYCADAADAEVLP